MKILYYDECLEEDQEYFTKEVVDEFERLGHSVEIYKFSESAKRKLASRHFQMYEELLDYAEKFGFDLIHHNNFLAVPEYFLSELRIRPDYGPKITLMFLFRELNRSLARATILKEIVDMPQVHRAIFISMISEPELKLPENFIK